MRAPSLLLFLITCCGLLLVLAATRGLKSGGGRIVTTSGRTTKRPFTMRRGEACTTSFSVRADPSEKRRSRCRYPVAASSQEGASKPVLSHEISRRYQSLCTMVAPPVSVLTSQPLKKPR